MSKTYRWNNAMKSKNRLMMNAKNDVIIGKRFTIIVTTSVLSWNKCSLNFFKIIPKSNLKTYRQ